MHNPNRLAATTSRKSSSEDHRLLNDSGFRMRQLAALRGAVSPLRYCLMGSSAQSRRLCVRTEDWVQLTGTIMRTRSAPLTLLSLACCASGRGTAGQRGSVEFRYSACRADFDTRCAQQNEPIAAGGAQVYITPTNPTGCGGPVAFSRADSTDPTVFTATVHDGIVIVTSANPGQADLRLLDDHGNEIDRKTLWIEPVAKIAVAAPGVTSATVLNGVTQTVHFDRFDTNGAVLMGYGGIAFMTPRPVVVDVPQPDPSDGYFYGSALAFHGSDGSAQIVAGAGAVSTTFPAAFVDASLITNVVVSPQHPHVVEHGHSLTEIDAAGALAETARLYSAPSALGSRATASLSTPTPASSNSTRDSQKTLHFDVRTSKDRAVRLASSDPPRNK